MGFEWKHMGQRALLDEHEEPADSCGGLELLFKCRTALDYGMWLTNGSICNEALSSLWTHLAGSQ